MTVPSLKQPVETDRVKALVELACTPGAESYLPVEDIDVESWNRIGDPLCEALIGTMRARKLMGGDIYANARALERQGLSEAVNFFADAEAVPSWLDVDALRVGAGIGRRNPMGMLFGVHGALPMTYLDPSTSEVMGSTGRLAGGGDFRRRFWETATGFIGALDVDGMLPGGESWILWVRIRFMHTMIRMGIERGGQWPRYETGVPISQLATAGATYIFGQYRVNIMEYFGGKVSREERDGFALMWRWVSRIEGANNQLLGRDHEEEFAIQLRIHEALAGTNAKTKPLMQELVNGTATMAVFGRSKRLNHAVARQLLSPSMVATAGGNDPRDTLGLEPRPVAETAVRLGASVLRGAGLAMRVRPVRRLAERGGHRMLKYSLERGLDGVKADYRGSVVAGRATDA
ncbi:oxygenase MpaB family protein [Rhodococcus sp. IEGM 1381]|uniref:oxygenase MpaB family protein n=1 Tax=Rhodococcus sp. IEGM 1381 TaxID=3047085 RepID=UPI0024B6C228|nr:oxygenase MpaB family protein [Rhodococcus sp. IEGM 1381]MDI9897385.1 oxygenase MpaB family protein [Rhodococcus sp. IEGM 1381]